MFGELLHQPQIYYFTICKLFKSFTSNIFIFWSSFCTLDTYCKMYWVMNENEMFQKPFFDFLTKRKSQEQVLYGMMEVLNLRKGACYKRINGETALTTAELVKLANHFQVSLDGIFQADNYISFQHSFAQNKTTFDPLSQFSFFSRPLNNPQSSKLTYLANELPVFYYFSHQYIYNFLSSIWRHMHSSESKLIIEENPNVPIQLETIRREISSYYAGHPVTEI